VINFFANLQLLTSQQKTNVHFLKRSKAMSEIFWQVSKGSTIYVAI
jgi:hypothetical protein